MYNLISLSESDKRFIFALALVILLLFVIVWYIGFIITRVMKSQGKKLDDAVHDVVVTRVITDPKSFKKYARKKNWRMFFKQAAVPLLICLIASLTLVIGNSIMKDFSYNPFSSVDKGFASLLFLWDFDNPDYYTTVFGMKVLSSWPPLTNTPHFVVNAIPSYIFVPGILVGGVWYLIVCQAFIARRLRIRALSKSIFEKSLDNYNQSQAFNYFNNNQQ
ncbi:MAG: hypothetical protein MJ227_02665 [Bacilli bacterium]|nr:hypothetical protein [Bacilli bacterium]